MDPAALEHAVEACFAARAGEFGLAAAGVRAEYILNRGVFVNRSYRVSDGQRSLHVKLTDDPQKQAALARWWSVHEHLEARYHAPPLLGWACIPGTGFAGPVSTWIDGKAPDRITQDLIGAVLPVVSRLHGDGELAARLTTGEPAPCWQTYHDTYHRRFVEDLEAVEAARPAFLSEATLTRLRVEAARMARAVRTAPAFQEPAASPIHGDLWANNLLVTPGGDWYLLDWDDLARGDPALDLATLLGPSPNDLQAAWWQALPGVAEGTLRERLALYSRASLLDWAIDPLADYVEATIAPEHTDRVRAEKRRVHEEAWALYRAEYGGRSALRPAAARRPGGAL